MQYGVVVWWGLTAAQQEDLMNKVVSPAREGPLAIAEKESDAFKFKFR